MAQLLLSEANKLSLDTLRQGVYETIVQVSPVLNYMPFMDIVGNSLKYTQENTLPSAQWHAVGDTWTADAPAFTQQTATLAILGGDADLDNFVARTRSSLQDVRATLIEQKSKAVAYAYETAFITGDGTGNTFSGIRSAIPAGQMQAAGANGASLTLGMLDELIDKIKPGKPDLLLMSRRTRRKLKSLLANNTHYIEMVSHGTQGFGRQVLAYDGIPCEVSDFVPDNEVQGTSGNICSSIYALRFGEDGVCGLQNGSIEVIEIGDLETQDARRTRVRWYCGMAIFNTLAAARLHGITAA